MVDLVLEVGYEALSMEGVAAAVRSSKATLYRRWNSKPHLVATAIRHTRPMEGTDLDTGSLYGDLHGVADQMGSATGDGTELMQAMAHASRRDPDLAAALRETMSAPRIALLNEILGRAVQRGEVAAECAAARFVPHLLVGAMMARFPVEGREPDADYLHQYVDLVLLPALTTERPPDDGVGAG
ncbi:TetR/AcrR family transcriptional regulator C-terminal ligand-binding domain-containing protein [Streptomyces sp. IBSNAI002]|uniref:TetR/AcrR family transcriptional regulator C-terminal ligand-binding domain-containing protein n=1 Tax=Streptomyces sp. IBSNAI002 TaxID=3457500 RepID=UPI003FD42DAC